MQTFLPYKNFAKSAACLDDKRLGKQRVEAWQILNSLRDPKHGWRHHPAVRMWRGCEPALREYLGAACAEWAKRGFSNEKMSKHLASLPKRRGAVKYPSWLGGRKFHASHRSNLLRKNSVHYGRFGWKEPPDLPYVWPERRTSL